MSTHYSSDIQQRIREQMAEGNYASEDELLHDALDALASRNADLAAVRMGVEDMEAGRMRPLADAADDIRKRHGWNSDA